MTANHSRKGVLLQTTLIFLGLFFSSALVTGYLKYHLLSQNPQPQLSFVNNVAARQQVQINKLLQLMQQRLMIAHDVARWKWNQKRPIEDRQREQELITKIQQQAITYNLQPDTVAVFFRGQIEAGKQIQQADFQTWQKLGVKNFTNVPDLNQTLRPSLDKLNVAFLPVLAELMPSLGCPAVRDFLQSRASIILRGNGISQEVQRTALAPMLEVKEASCQKVSLLTLPYPPVLLVGNIRLVPTI
ncbi:gamma subclass chorismate mutase AroQ [Brasilonema octagenarum UFV-E1]|uniref:chorismate mutase n=2 Tax=Brasilonema TaxID=383614 RepID=A0A856MIE9_9CYAN|nr:MULTISPECIES: gamma subclass chorismate mutase AroQ [Brasilonema]NMF64740.1 gamma subclass chorismate mutase AroQ [Brasilonema octagenarum UFV-OR1]QDL10352.1 gamma subclass chorismate mutase AroQ [Brasilonema sennae CENA114]QDL16699.1 gamma subclass chorismate mutase AroQ [Brasilonema octagenarum UFV-E1]